jgi:hypothetical protein
MKIRSVALLIVGLVSLLFAYAGTGGTPLGGFGTGYITYNAVNNVFKKGTQPTGWYAETQLTGGFHFYTNVNATVATRLNATTATEDAKIPIYTADYAALQNVHITLLAFAPINSGDEKLASLPLAFFEFTVTNNNNTAADAAVAWQFSPFEGGAATKITNGIFWPGTQNTTMLASVDSGAATISTGTATTEFTDDGVMNNGAGNILAVKVSVPAGKSAKIRFVYAWYRSFGNGENFYYYNYYANSQDIATYGMQNFNTVRDGANNIVNKTMASNLPVWFKDRLLNNLYPLIHNAQMAQDGRTAVREGCFTIIGTIDQQGHAQIPLSYWFPDHNWRQMRFWAHTQFRGGATDGAIHHDFNGNTETMCAWEAYTHSDYRTGIDQWGDLNLHFIIGTYELFLASGNIDSLTALWPYLKKTGARSIIQCGTHYVPTNCLSSYDRTGATDQYNGCLALVAYQAMANMATVMNDQAEVTKWTAQVANAKAQYLQLYWNATYGTDEAHLAGYAFARSLGMSGIVPDSVARITFKRMYAQYSNGTNTGLWHAYTCAHFGDLGIAIGSVDSGMVNHQADWNEYYNGHAAYVFWQNLDHAYTNCSYMTMPFVWRSLFLIEGYCIDMYHKILWIRPNLPSSVNKHLTGGVITTADAWGTLDYAESATDPMQNITITYDKPVTFKTVVLRNNTGIATPTVVATKGAAATPVALTAVTEGSGLDANIRVTFTSDLAIDNTGVNIKVYKNPVKAGTRAMETNIITGIGRLVNGSSVVFSLANSSSVRLELFDLTGRQVKTLASGNMPAGRHTAFMPAEWTGAGVLRLITNDKSIVRCVIVPR